MTDPIDHPSLLLDVIRDFRRFADRFETVEGAGFLADVPAAETFDIAQVHDMIAGLSVLHARACIKQADR